MGLQDLIAADAASLKALGDFSETAIIRNTRTGDTYTIPVWVTRKVPTPVPGTQASGPELMVHITKSSDATEGLPSIDVGALAVTISDREGGTATEHRTRAVESQSPGGWWISLR